MKSLHKNYVVCENHFSRVCKDDNRRLLRYSLRILNLPAFHEPSSEENCFYHPRKLRESRQMIPSTSTHSPQTCSVKIPEKVYGGKVKMSAKRSLFLPEMARDPCVQEETSVYLPSTSHVVTSSSEHEHLQRLTYRRPNYRRQDKHNTQRQGGNRTHDPKCGGEAHRRSASDNLVFYLRYRF
ncbi:uncharacterized protein LOC135133594 [Zophobas morio]|uniref:uncharacterized protein LOC135133594 n=1 Tax=Zophobas morio TaxID=2755281 RepID=UPI0030835363